MGSQGKHVAGARPSVPTAAGKHADPRPGRPLGARIVVGAVALALAVVASLAVLGQTASSPSARAKAVTVSSDDDLAAPAPVGLRRLVVYGHSMPAGGGASDPSRGYAVLAAERLGLALVNHSEGGTGAANATLTMGSARPADAQDAVVLHTGMNDVFRRGEAAVGRGRQAVRRFLAGTDEAGRRVVVLECQPGSWQHTPPERNLQAAYEAWNTMLREEAAAARQVDVVDICEIWNPRRFTTAHRFHPNDEGHARLAAEVAAVLSAS